MFCWNCIALGHLVYLWKIRYIVVFIPWLQSIQASIFWMYRFHPTFFIHHLLFFSLDFSWVFHGKLASSMYNLIWKQMICKIFMPHFMSESFQRFQSTFNLEKSTHKIKQPRELHKSLLLEQDISTHHKRIHPQNLNLLFIIEIQNNFEF